MRVKAKWDTELPFVGIEAKINPEDRFPHKYIINTTADCEQSVRNQNGLGSPR